MCQKFCKYTRKAQTNIPKARKGKNKGHFLYKATRLAASNTVK